MNGGIKSQFLVQNYSRIIYSYPFALLTAWLCFTEGLPQLADLGAGRGVIFSSVGIAKRADCMGTLHVGHFGFAFIDVCRLDFRHFSWKKCEHGRSWVSTFVTWQLEHLVAEGTSTELSIPEQSKLDLNFL